NYSTFSRFLLSPHEKSGLEISWNGNAIEFRDVRLADHCNNEGEWVNDRRPAVGVPLAEIWAPIRLDAQDQAFEVAFSESPLPAARLNRLQRDPTLRHYRCRRITNPTPWDQPTAGFTQQLTPRDRPVFYLDKVAPQRPREPGREWQFELPWHYLEDLTGHYGAQAIEPAQALYQEYQHSDRTTPLADCERPEPGAWGLCIQQDVDRQNRQPPTRPFRKEDWQPQPAAADTLASLRERGVCGLQIDDRLYEMRHQQARIHTARHLLALCGEKARQSPHLDSAHLVDQVVLPYTINGQRNPLSQYASALPSQGRRRIERILMAEERQLGRDALDAAQDELRLSLKRQPYQQVLGDLFAAEGFDYAAAFRCTGRFISDILEPACKYDPLHPDQAQATPDTDGKEWLRGLCGEHEAISASRDEVSLARMLWPEASPAEQCNAYQPPLEVAANPGDGVFRGHILAALEEQDLPEDLSEIVTVEGLQLASDLQSGALNALLFAGVASGSKAIDSAHSDLHLSIQSALAAADNNDTDLTTLKTDQRNLAQAEASLTQELETNLRQALNENEAAYAVALKAGRDAQARFEQQRIALEQQLSERRAAITQRLAERRTAQLSRPFEGLRQAMPHTLQGLRQIPLNDAIAQGHYILGLEDLDASGARVTPPADPRIQAWVLDRDHPSTRALSALNRAQNELILAQRTRAEAHHTRTVAELGQRLTRARQAFNRVSDELAAIRGNHAKVTQEIQATKQALRSNTEAMDTTASSRWYRTLNTPVLPVVVLGIEAVNVWNAFTVGGELIRGQRGYRATAGVISSSYNTGLAALLLAERFADNWTQRKAANFLAYEFKHETATAIAKFFGAEALTVKMLTGAIGGLAAAGISFSDTLYALDTGDPASLGYGVMTTSGVVAALGAMVPAQAILLGMGPLGWVALGLGLAGAYLVMEHQDEPFENWLRNGPFGDHNGLPHLQGEANATEALYRLVGLLANLRLVQRRIPVSNQVRSQLLNSLANPPAGILDDATHLILLDSNLPGLTATTNLERTFEAKLRTTRFEMNSNSIAGGINVTPAPDYQHDAVMLHQQSTATGELLLVKTPPRQIEKVSRLGFLSREYDVHYYWRAKAQYRLELKGQQVAFPAPPPKDTTRYDPKNSEHTEPDMNDNDQLFWLNGFTKEGGA
ncbi:ABC transporter permease, partial [Marinobacter mobilis]|uniref:ABC transporter permease n=1 Tax=Marinobacter mobilis TaxID=488533 RepID=UPI0035C67268